MIALACIWLAVSIIGGVAVAVVFWGWKERRVG